MTTYQAASHVQFTPPDGPEATGMLIDERESVLIELNSTACAAWSLLVGNSDPTLQAYATRVGLATAQAAAEIDRFAESLRAQGWIEVTDPTAPGPTA
jgi:Coenzyme PQQ synthesis protein D (PqqD)